MRLRSYTFYTQPGQTTCTTPGISVGHVTAPVASGVTPGSHKSDITPAGMDRHSLSMEDLL